MSETLPNRISSDDDTASYDLLREECGLVELGAFSALVLSGEDRKGWLQGQVTNDLRNLQIGGSIDYCQCSPTGQIEAISKVWSLPGRLIISASLDAAPSILERVEKMVILEDVHCTRSEDIFLSIQGPESTRALGAMLSLPSLDAGEAEFGSATVSCLRSNRTGFGGWDLLIPASAKKELSEIRRAFRPITEIAFKTTQLEAGIPTFGVDTDSRTLPPELGKAFQASHVSYTKGCYTGQEVLMRIFSRGHTNRTWMGLLSECPIPVGAAVIQGAQQQVGLVTSSAASPELGFIGAAMLKNEAAQPGETLAIDGVPVEVVEMPILRFG